MVCSEEDAHIQLVGSQKIEIVTDTLMYFKINVAKKLAPCRLLI